MTKSFITTNAQLQELAREARENWLFDEGTDPNGKVAQGLDVILSGDVSDTEVADVFQVDNFPKRSDKWDAIEDWAKRLT
ncbi:hypothetical protein LCGC14_1877380 [marine sediment metagenome]|uniref:Uncharacterized protein n=1 Tax=marine sediment metagenome TaxID=412755 RepID=A0A0F9J1U9_9ZZZZ